MQGQLGGCLVPGGALVTRNRPGLQHLVCAGVCHVRWIADAIVRAEETDRDRNGTKCACARPLVPS